MIDIPIGKALVPVKGKECKMCFFGEDKMLNGNEKRFSICNLFDCAYEDREDGKDAVFELADYPPKV